MLDTPTQDRLLRRIGLAGAPPPDAAGLRTVHRAFVSHVPFETIAVQLGESAPLDPDALVDRVLRGGRGGYCFEVNTVLHALLESLGFSVERRQGIVGPRDGHAAGEPTSHLTLVVDTSDGPFIADGGLGEGAVDPLPLAEGPAGAEPLTWRLERDGDGWWVAQHAFGSMPGFRFGDAPATLADFAPHHERIATSPDSRFVQAFVVQQPYDDHIVTQRARTLSVAGPDRGEHRVVEDADAFAGVLEAEFGIDPAVLGPERLGRLWAKAAAQHEAHAGG